MEKLDKHFEEWINESPPDDEIKEMLELLRIKQEGTFRVLKGIHDHERDEVANLQERLNLLRGEGKRKSTPTASAGNVPVETAMEALNTARSSVISTLSKGTEMSVLAREDSELILTIIKTVFKFVQEEQQEQAKKISELLHMDKGNQNKIQHLQRSLSYDIEKALLEAFFDDVWMEKIYHHGASKSSLITTKDNVNVKMKDFVSKCIQLVWIMLLETPSLQFCWEKSKLHYRYYGAQGEVDRGDRIILPAIVVASISKDDKRSSVIKGKLQREDELGKSQNRST
ncbi:uncharacterized protein LOC132558016 [Ylistrum balloti]|uniref:uncharacterized protein LOC132558016 n=1 Tax=Ylistrum balloti TaxID=509963 RepID=UPI002905ED85|nr:uncharacterized protein LOC132558016 [Ylistrum balloti]